MIDTTSCGFDSWEISIGRNFQVVVIYWTHPFGLDLTLCDASADDFRKLAMMFNRATELKDKVKS